MSDTLPNTVQRLGDSQPLESNLWALAMRPSAAIKAYGPEWAGWCAASALDALAARQQAAQAVPAGFKLVPVEPTWDMKISASTAYREARDGHYTARMEQAAECWAAMLAAAPAAPAPEASA